MKYLLDTHAFIWTATCTNKHPEKIKKIIISPENEIYVSAISFWEITIKSKIGKLDLDGINPIELPDLAFQMDIATIELSGNEAITYNKLTENTHRDPFDRMLIWQSICRNMVLISKDNEFYKFLNDGLILDW